MMMVKSPANTSSKSSVLNPAICFYATAIDPLVSRQDDGGEFHIETWKGWNTPRC
jgi:hypothetical protein